MAVVEDTWSRHLSVPKPSLHNLSTCYDEDLRDFASHFRERATSNSRSLSTLCDLLVAFRLTSDAPDVLAVSDWSHQCYPLGTLPFRERNLFTRLANITLFSIFSGQWLTHLLCIGFRRYATPLPWYGPKSHGCLVDPLCGC